MVAQNRMRQVRSAEFGNFFGREMQIYGGDGLVELGELAGTDDGGRDARLCQDPGEGNLGVGYAAAGGDAGNGLDNGKVTGMVIVLLG